MQLLNTIVSAITTPIRTLYYWGSQCLPGVKSLAKLSLPTKWSLVALLFCIINFVAAILAYYQARDSQTKNFFLTVIVFLVGTVIIPILVYYFVKYLLMEERSRYPDIDRIWYEGVHESESKGLVLSNTPIFLILGVKSHRQVKSLVELTELDFGVNVPPSGDSAISFHACSRGVFVFLNGCSCISRLSLTSNSAGAVRDITQTSPLPQSKQSGTIDAASFGFDPYSAPVETPMPSMSLPMQGGAASGNAGGTMHLEDLQELNEIWTQQSTSRSLSSQEIAECDDKLRHVCKLIRKTRGSLCPINGVVTALSMELVESSCGPLQVSIQKDLAVLREELQVRCSVTAIVTGMEEEEGFIEFIRRLPPQQVVDNRMGKGCDIWAAPELSRLEAVAVHATGTFEDWIYMLFQQDNSLKMKYNSRLFQLLCRVRGQFATNLREVLSRGFGFDPMIEPQLAFEQFLFSGCYFVAAGVGPSQQAFVKSVFAKTLDQEGELEWSPAARRTDAYYQFLANLAALVGMVALGVTIAVLVYHFNFAQPET